MDGMKVRHRRGAARRCVISVAPATEASIQSRPLSRSAKAVVRCLRRFGRGHRVLPGEHPGHGVRCPARGLRRLSSAPFLSYVPRPVPSRQASRMRRRNLWRLSAACRPDRGWHRRACSSAPAAQAGQAELEAFLAICVGSRPGSAVRATSGPVSPRWRRVERTGSAGCAAAEARVWVNYGVASVELNNHQRCADGLYPRHRRRSDPAAGLSEPRRR